MRDLVHTRKMGCGQKNKHNARVEKELEQTEEKSTLVSCCHILMVFLPLKKLVHTKEKIESSDVMVLCIQFVNGQAYTDYTKMNYRLTVIHHLL